MSIRVHPWFSLHHKRRQAREQECLPPLRVLSNARFGIPPSSVELNKMRLPWAQGLLDLWLHFHAKWYYMLLRRTCT